MNRYEGLCCPVCKAKLFDDEDIVVCPDCGAPHHGDCWNQLHHCAYADAHGTENQWMPPKFKLPHEDVRDDLQQEQLRAQREKRSLITDDYDGDDDGARSRIIEKMLVAGGVDKNERLGGERAENIAMFIGVNVPRYLRVFKEMLFNNAKIGWNWLAFLVPQLWLFSRKCYKAGSIAAAYALFNTIMLSLIMGSGSDIYNLLTSASKDVSLLFTNPLLLAYMILLGLSLVVHIIFGMFGDYIYKNHVFSSIKALHESGEDDDDTIIKTGGISFFAPVLVYFIIEMLAVIIPMFI